ncbi:HNH endonuclease [Candidatus Poriferisodalis sp.]|uniref:HNH endonuclease n=1 Tax=Candidatus Poriferisodalis sp. TaxID=3101277 RepID=UPI003D0E3865
MFIDPPAYRTCGDGSAASTTGSTGCAAVAEHEAGAAVTALDAVAGVDLGALSNSDLEDRVVGLVALRARVEGEYLAALGEMTSRCGAQSAAYQLREFTRMNAAQARTESRLAESLVEHDLSATLDALKCGQIQTSHAKVIAREAPQKHRRSEDEFLELCRTYPCDTVARNPLAYESLAVYADLEAEAAAAGLSPIDAELALQRFERSGSMRMGDDGTPLSARQLADYAVDANVLPAVFSADWSQLALGRTRNASDAQRLILAVRDGGCIGCELTSEPTRAHHIQYFENNGLTEIPNLASLCEPCHHDLHQHDTKIDTPPDGRPRLLPPEHDHSSPPARAPATARSP